MRRLTTMNAAVAAVQEHLAGPLGARARAQHGAGPAGSVVFEHWSNTVSVWFDPALAGGRQPAWVKVTVGAGKALCRGEAGFTLADQGSLGLAGARLWLQGDQGLAEVLQGALAAIRAMPKGRPRRSKPVNSPDKALRLVQKELAGPLEGTAALHPADARTVVCTLAEGTLCVQFSRDPGYGAPEWVRVSLSGGQDLLCTPGGYRFARPGSEEQALHPVHTFGDTIEVLRGAHAALQAGRSAPPAPPDAVLELLRTAFVDGLALEGAEVTAAVTPEQGFVATISAGGETAYTLVLDPAFAQADRAGRWVQLHVAPGRCLADRGDSYAVEPVAAEGSRLPVEGLESLGATLASCAAYLVRVAAELHEVPAAAAVTEAAPVPLSDQFWSAHIPGQALHTRTVLRKIRRELNAGRWFRQLSTADMLAMASKHLGHGYTFAEGEVAAPLAIAAAVWARKAHGLTLRPALSLGAFVADMACGEAVTGLDEEHIGPVAQAEAELRARQGSRPGLAPWETDRFLQDLVTWYRGEAQPGGVHDKRSAVE
jgi:hypothetical protein